MPAEVTLKPANQVQLSLHIDIAAPVATVWQSFLQDIARWWALADFTVTGGTMALEPFAGGRLFEKNAAGHEVLWATVMEIKPQERIVFHGAMAPPYAKACLTLFAFTFTSTSEGTCVTIYDHLIGDVDETTVPTMTDGWTQLFERGLKRLVEENRRDA